VQAKRDDIVKWAGMLKELQEAETAQRTAEASRRRWETLNTTLTAREKHIAESAQELVTVKPPEADEEELQQIVSSYEVFTAAQNELQPIIQQTREKIAKLTGLLAAVTTRRQTVLDIIKGITVTASDAHLAKVSLEDIRQKCQQRQVLEQDRSRLAADIAQFKEQYLATQKKENDAVKIRRWSALAERTRDALKNAPRLVAQRNLQRLETAINELLQIFSVNFLVRVAGDGTPTFVAEFYDGRKQVAQRLSIGQKTVLALAFRVAVNAQFAEEIGLLALDEPTASLDAPRIQALAPVLEKLRDLSTAKGLQCLLVTHAASLSNLFESTIELEAPELRHVRPAR
jgi:DNA repair exonuclease SbcCD ATPase subunit